MFKWRAHVRATDLLEVLLVLYGGHDIIESVFITFGCNFDVFHGVFECLPFDTRSEQFVLSKNVVTCFTQETKLSFYVCREKDVIYDDNMACHVMSCYVMSCRCQ